MTTQTSNLRIVVLLGLIVATSLTALGYISSIMDAREQATRAEADPAPPGWMVDDLMAEARQITKDAADGTTAG